MSCPEIRRVLAIVLPENREGQERVYSLCYEAVCTPLLSAPGALEVLIDLRMESGSMQGRVGKNRLPPEQERQRMLAMAWRYAARRCGMIPVRGRVKEHKAWLEPNKQDNVALRLMHSFLGCGVEYAEADALATLAIYGRWPR